MFFLDLLIISVTDGHTDSTCRSAPLPRAPIINYVIVKFSNFYLFSLFGAIPAASLRTEARLTVADWRQRQSLWVHLLTDAGEAGVRLGRAEL